MLRDALALRLREGWEAQFWPELTPAEKRRYRAVWAETTAYEVGDEVYHPGSDGYYQALRASTGEVPATESDGEWTENSEYWAACATGYSADEWEAETEYEVGDQVFVSEEGEYFQCHTAHTSGSEFEAGYWGMLTDFDAYVAYQQTGETEIGTVAEVYARNPRVYRNAQRLGWTLSDSGVQVPGGPNTVWIEFRLPAPEIVGDVLDTSRAYVDGEQAYFRSETVPGTWPGDWYECVGGAEAGKTPETDAAKWTKVELPQFLSGWLVGALYADALLSDGQNDKAAVELQRAYAELDRQAAVLVGQQAQARRIAVETR